MSNRRRYSNSDGEVSEIVISICIMRYYLEILVNQIQLWNERDLTRMSALHSALSADLDPAMYKYFARIPINVYLPQKDAEGNPINTQISDSPFRH